MFEKHLWKSDILRKDRSIFLQKLFKISQKYLHLRLVLPLLLLYLVVLDLRVHQFVLVNLEIQFHQALLFVRGHRVLLVDHLFHSLPIRKRFFLDTQFVKLPIQFRL